MKFHWFYKNVAFFFFFWGGGGVKKETMYGQLASMEKVKKKKTFNFVRRCNTSMHCVHVP